MEEGDLTLDFIRLDYLSQMEWFTTVLIYVFSVYVIVSILLYYLQDYLLFKPERLDKDFVYQYENQIIEEYNVETPDGANINGLHFKVDKPIGVVLYLKGNSKSIKGWGKFAVDFTRHQYDVVMLDYRGFGKSTGKFNQEIVKRDLQFVYDKIKSKVKEKYIVLYGRSLGSGFATKLASTNEPKILILDAPYYSLKNVTKRYAPFMPLSLILKYPIPTYKWLKYVKCPIHIIHGTEDKLIPFSSSIKLSKVNPEKSRLWPVIGGGHKNLNTFKSYHHILSDIMTHGEQEIELNTTSHKVDHYKD